jgi:hypothetical protein
LKIAARTTKPAIDATFDVSKPKSYGQAIDDLKTEWKNFLAELAQGGAFDFVKDELAGLTRSARDTAAELQSIAATIAGAWKTINSIGSQNVGAGSFGGMGPEQFGQSNPDYSPPS